MEGFKKQVYKKEEYQDEIEKEINPDTLKSSENIANEKLSKIMEHGFKDFAVRYMNLEEYRELIEKGNLSGEFILSDKLYGNPNSFSEFIKKFGNVYDSKNQLGQTMWEEMSGVTILETGNIIEQIKYIEASNKDKSLNEKNQIIRDYIFQYLNSQKLNISRFIEYVRFDPGWAENSIQRVENYEDRKKYYKDIDFIPEEDHLKLREKFLEFMLDKNGYPEDKYAEEKANKYNLNKDQEHKLRLYLNSIKAELDLGVENLKIINEFKENPDFLNQKDGLRKIITALGNIHDWVIEEKQHRQYHLALIVDKKITLGEKTGESWGIDGWRNVYSKNINDLNLNSSILGVISIYPLKDMYKEIFNIERGSGDIAHPVFDNKGIIRWPEK